MRNVVYQHNRVFVIFDAQTFSFAEMPFVVMSGLACLITHFSSECFVVMLQAEKWNDYRQNCAARCDGIIVVYRHKMMMTMVLSVTVTVVWNKPN